MVKIRTPMVGTVPQAIGLRSGACGRPASAPLPSQRRGNTCMLGQCGCQWLQWLLRKVFWRREERSVPRSSGGLPVGSERLLCRLAGGIRLVLVWKRKLQRSLPRPSSNDQHSPPPQSSSTGQRCFLRTASMSRPAWQLTLAPTTATICWWANARCYSNRVEMLGHHSQSPTPPPNPT